MLTHTQRLSRDQDIKQVLRAGRRTAGQLYQTIVLPTQASQLARAAVIVSRRVHPSAVARHRIQRRLREVAREILTVHPRGYDMVVVARAGAADRSQSDLQAAAAPTLTVLKQLVS